jgi:hypothetical protein
MTEIFCASCSEVHEGDVRIDSDGWPSVTWIGRPHDPDEVARQKHLDAISEDGGKALALALDAGDWVKVEEVLDQVLGWANDPEDG